MLRVGDVLLDRKLVTEEQIEEALAAQKASTERRLLGEIIVEMGFCTETEILDALARAYGIPFAKLTPRTVDPLAAALLPREFIDSNNVLPLFLVDGVLTLAVAEPSNVFIADEVAQTTGHEVQLVASPKADIQAAAEATFKIRPTDSSDIDDILAEAHESQDATPTDVEALEDLQGEDSDSPVVKLVTQLVASAVREGASDIHVEPGDDTLRVRYRVDGRLYEKMKPPYAMNAALVARIKILGGLDIAERRMPQDGAIRMTVDARQVDLRVSTLPNRFGEKVVIRILDTENALIGLDMLGMDEDLREAFEAEIHKPHGLVLVTGPTGSGKSTTLYSSLQVIISPETNICTVEDPIEYNLDGINQFQVHDQIGLSFPGMLRSLLRQDPDMIMIGEIRDPDTARIAVQAAMTGHLVLSTLHTNDGPSAVSRLTNLSVEPYLISTSLEAVLAQRLIRCICPDCKTETDTPAHTRHTLDRMGIDAPRMLVGRGCTSCHQRGTKGRLGIYEFFRLTDELRDAVTVGASTAKLRELALDGGMKSIREDGIAKAVRGLTTFDEVLRATAA